MCSSWSTLTRSSSLSVAISWLSSGKMDAKKSIQFYFISFMEEEEEDGEKSEASNVLNVLLHFHTTFRLFSFLFLFFQLLLRLCIPFILISVLPFLSSSFISHFSVPYGISFFSICRFASHSHARSRLAGVVAVALYIGSRRVGVYAEHGVFEFKYIVYP